MSAPDSIVQSVSCGASARLQKTVVSVQTKGCSAKKPAKEGLWALLLVAEGDPFFPPKTVILLCQGV